MCALLFPLAASAVLAAACTSSDTSLTDPSSPKCRVSVANSMESVPAGGGSGTLTVTTARDCTWAASTSTTWIVITSPSNGQGDGSIAYRVAANADPSPRQAAIDVNDSKTIIAQQPAECRFTMTTRPPSVGAGGGTITVQIEATANCPWTATTDANWIHITAGASGRASGSVSFAVDANTGPARQGTVLAAGETIVISQEGAPSAAPPPAPQPPAPQPPPGCSYSLQPTGETIPAAGATRSVGVSAGPTCAWTAVSNDGWITVTAGASGTGSGTVSYSVPPNNGASRTGAISVAGQTFTVTQAAIACSYSISPAGDAVTAAGGTTTVTVTAGASCNWVAASNVPWMTISSGATGSGNGTVKIAIAANSGAGRTGTATVAGQTFTVTQAAPPCTYSLLPTTIDIAAAGGSGSTMLTTGPACPWTVTASASWISLTSAASGTGGGSITFTVAANPGAARSGTIAIADQTLTVNQQAACTFSIMPTSQTVAANGGSGSVGVTTSSGCAWTASSNNPDWLTISGGASGTGSGTVTFAASPNPGPAPRSGTLTIAGHTFTVTQDTPCSFSIAPTSQMVPAAGGGGSIAITAGSTCSWTAVSNSTDWLTISGAASGTGNGTVTFAAAANSGPPRNGTITIAGQTFTAIQAAP